MNSQTARSADRASGPTLDGLLLRNRAWVERRTAADPGFFERLVGQQQPDYFWIGCSDSRVPATEIVDLDPGEMFVHRNVANLAPVSDPNFGAALAFAVEGLRVRHIIVVGHYGCGGIHAAFEPPHDDPLGQWLAPVRALRSRHWPELGGIADAGRRSDRLCELNIVEQVTGLAENPVVEAAWRLGYALALHGWAYAIGDGLLKSVCGPITAPLGTGREMPVHFSTDACAHHG